jgi:hypothetical protein
MSEPPERYFQVDKHCQEANHRYLIPGHVGSMISATLFGLPKGEIGLHMNALARQDEDGMKTTISNLESHILGLSSLAKGTWHESPAGFGGGSYPVSEIAQSIDMSSEQFREIVDDDRQRENVLLRSGRFLFDAQDTADKDRLMVTTVHELTLIGSAVLETSLGAYVMGVSRGLTLPYKH